MHWKEAELPWRKRRKRVAEANGGVVPAYATAAGGAATEVEPPKPKRRRDRITSPESPDRQVGREEFDDMVADLGLEEQEGRSATATAEAEEDVTPAPKQDPSADLSPEDLVLKDEPTKKPKRPRNRRHGR